MSVIGFDCRGCTHEHIPYGCDRCLHCVGGDLFEDIHKDTAESRMQAIRDFAESKSFEEAEILAFAARVEEVGRAIEAAVLYSIELKRRARRDKIEKFLGFQRRILQWVFNAQKIKRAKP